MEHKEKPMFIEDGASPSEERVEDEVIFSSAEREQIKQDIFSDLAMNSTKGKERNSNVDGLNVDNLTDRDLEMWKKQQELVKWSPDDPLSKENEEYIEKVKKDFADYTTYTFSKGGDSSKLRAYLHDKLINGKFNFLYHQAL